MRLTLPTRLPTSSSYRPPSTPYLPRSVRPPLDFLLAFENDLGEKPVTRLAVDPLRRDLAEKNTPAECTHFERSLNQMPRSSVLRLATPANLSSLSGRFASLDWVLRPVSLRILSVGPAALFFFFPFFFFFFGPLVSGLAPSRPLAPPPNRRGRDFVARASRFLTEVSARLGGLEKGRGEADDGMKKKSICFANVTLS